MLDCSTVFAVGVDKFIQQFDIRSGKVANKYNVQNLASMNYISSPQAGSTENFYDMLSKTRTGQKSKLVRMEDLFELLISHQDGSISNW